MRRLVFFDFDGTLTRRDTLWSLGRLLAGAKSGTNGLASLARFAWLTALLKLRLVSNHDFKERFAKLLLADEAAERIERLVERFHDRHLPPNLNSPVVHRLLHHVASGDEVYLVSSNYDFFLLPLVRRWRIAGVIASEAEVARGRFTGRLGGPACHGPEKLKRVTSQFGYARVRDAVSYGDDSKADIFLMSAVKEAYWVGKAKARHEKLDTRLDLV
jgi:phosphatidylglycerophosphatase C